MLESLYVKDLALIEELSLDIGPGLSCFTGETGAGKSLLIGAIQGIHGARMGREWIREGCGEARIEAVFSEVAPLLDIEQRARYLTDEDEDLLIIARSIKREGRGICRVNGQRITLRELRDLGSRLSQIHGQHEAQRLFEPEEQLTLLDRYAGEALAAALAQWRSLRAELKALRRRKHDLVADPEKRRRVYKLLERQLNYIDEVNPQPGEREALAKKQKIYRTAELACEQLYTVERYLHGTEDQGDEASVLDLFSLLRRELKQARHRIGGKQLQVLLDRSEHIYEELMNLSRDLKDLRNSLDTDPEVLPAIEARIRSLDEMEAAFGRSIDEIPAYHRILNERFRALLDSEKEQERLIAEEKLKEDELQKTAETIRILRYEAGERLVASIQASLADLAMPHAEFSLRWEASAPGPRGQDRLEFYFTANPGEPAKPLAASVSGGEASRIMLAVKVVLADADEVPVLIFDEVDQGISGDTATRVGKLMRILGHTHQVLAVTHQAQLAVQAEQHYFIHKEIEGGRTRTRIDCLEEAGRIEELGRLLGASLAENEALALAREILSQVRRDSSRS